MVRVNPSFSLSASSVSRLGWYSFCISFFGDALSLRLGDFNGGESGFATSGELGGPPGLLIGMFSVSCCTKLRFTGDLRGDLRSSAVGVLRFACRGDNGDKGCAILKACCWRNGLDMIKVKLGFAGGRCKQSPRAKLR